MDQVRYSNGTEYSPDSAKIYVARKLKEVEELLISNQYNYQSSRDRNYVIVGNPESASYGFVVTLQDRQALKMLVSDISAIELINGSIGEVQYED